MARASASVCPSATPAAAGVLPSTCARPPRSAPDCTTASGCAISCGSARSAAMRDNSGTIKQAMRGIGGYPFLLRRATSARAAG